MTIVPLPFAPRASVFLILDTRPPILDFDADREVEPPDDWVVQITADEPIGDAPLGFRDSLGYLHSVGYEWINDRTLRLHLPTVGLPTDWGVLEGEVADRACNAAPVSLAVYIRRQRSFDVVMSFGRTLDVDLSLDESFMVEVGTGRAFDIRVILDGPFEVSTDIGRTRDVEVSLGSNA